MNFWNYNFWDVILQLTFLLITIVIANVLRRKITWLRKSLLPSALIAGLIVLVPKSLGWLDNFLSDDLLNMITYHCICVGFIALGLKKSYGNNDNQALSTGLDSGATIVGTYLIQALVAFGATLLLSVTIFPDLFPASGILLPLGFGQGPGQASNFGAVYQSLGFVGGHSFAMTLASVGFLVGCIIGVIYINIMRAKGKIKIVEETEHTSVSVESDPEHEMPLSEPVDSLTMNLGIIGIVFILTYLFMAGINKFVIEPGYLGDFGTKTLLPLIFGFNFIIGTLFAILYKAIFKKLRKHGIAKHEYTSNSMLNRISGFCFDLMILAGVLLIDLSVLADLIIPLVVVCVLGTIATYMYLNFVCKHKFGASSQENFLGFFGMLTGTASTGVALIRVIDPKFKTDASDNLVTGSTVAIVLGFPMMLLVSLAPTNPWLTLAIVVLLFAVMNMILFRNKLFKKKAPKTSSNTNDNTSQN